MPGVKKLHQESENSSKAAYIFGHLFGTVGVLMRTTEKHFCLPLSMNLQDGVKRIFSWKEPAKRQESHVVQMIDQGFMATQAFGESLLLLDRYFLSAPALDRLEEWNASDPNTQMASPKLSQTLWLMLLLQKSKRKGEDVLGKKGAL